MNRRTTLVTIFAALALFFSLGGAASARIAIRDGAAVSPYSLHAAHRTVAHFEHSRVGKCRWIGWLVAACPAGSHLDVVMRSRGRCPHREVVRYTGRGTGVATLWTILGPCETGPVRVVAQLRPL